MMMNDDDDGHNATKRERETETYRSGSRRCCLRSRLARYTASTTQCTNHCHSGTATADILHVSYTVKKLVPCTFVP